MQSDIRLGKHLKNWTPGSYRILVEGLLDVRRSDCLAGMLIESLKRPDQSVVTTLTGDLRDQSQLLGVLNYLYDLHLPILMVEYLEKNNGV